MRQPLLGTGTPATLPMARGRPALFSTGVLAASLTPPTGNTLDLGADPAGETSLINFRFDTFVKDGGNSAIAVFDPYEAVHFESVKGRLLILDGMTTNREYDGDVAVDLEIIAPSSAPTSALAAGALTGDYAWKYRYRNSKTGKVSGFSPIKEETLSSQKNTVTVAGSYDAQVDRIEVFRNINGFKALYYLTGEVDDPGGGSTTTYEDNNADTTIKDNIMDETIQGKTYAEGRMHPVTKALELFGFVWYYGLVRMGKIDAGTVTGTAAQDNVTLNGPKVTWARLGQRMVIASDTTEYRIIDVDITNNKYHLYPVLATSPSTATYEIFDDRDGRSINISEAGRPGSVPVSHLFTLGADIDDILHHIFELNDQLYGITEKRIVKIDGYRTEEPWLTLVATTVVPEGCIGPRAAKVVSNVGLVYLHPTLGPRVFNGAYSSYLGREPSVFILRDEWARVRTARKREMSVFYDSVKGYIVFPYARDQESALTFELAYDPQEKEWTGPWTRRVFTYGELLDVDATPRVILGSDLGHIVQDHKGELDGGEAGTLSGTLTSVSDRVFTDTGAAFATDGEALFGRLIEFKDPQGQASYGIVVSNDATTFTTYLFPAPYPLVGWTYRVGVIPWVVQTGYAVSPLIGRNLHLNTLEVAGDRAVRGSIRGAVSSEGGDLYEAPSGEVDMTGRVFGRFKVREGGTVFQVAVWGSDRGGSLKLTQAELQVEVRGGEAK